jgi:hypothetical protein
VKLSVSIMAHRQRQAEAEELQGWLGGDTLIAWDPNPKTSADPRQRWVTGRAAWEMYDPHADYHMVIQDDAIPAQDLVKGLEQALDVLGPEGLVAPYSGTGKPHQGHMKRNIAHADAMGHAWWSTKSLCWGVAIVAPVRTIDRMLHWCSLGPRVMLNYDMRIGMYYRDVLKWRTWYTNPSLVEHRDGVSLVGHGTTVEGGRKAHNFLADGSALDVDWTRTPPKGLVVKW